MKLSTTIKLNCVSQHAKKPNPQKTPLLLVVPSPCHEEWSYKDVFWFPDHPALRRITPDQDLNNILDIFAWVMT